jgi:hypothetical protein
MSGGLNLVCACRMVVVAPATTSAVGRMEGRDEIASVHLKIIGHQFIKGFASAPVNLRRGRVDQVAVAIERAEKTFFIKSNTWLNPLQRIPIDKK